jgi:multimeric flavodoxin WrbA
MKITTIIGSPRSKGNSATIARALVETLLKSGAQNKTFELNNLSYRGCQGCMACKTTSEKCVVKDDLEEVLEDIRTSEATIIATPVYVGEVTSQTKGLLDRFYSFYKNDFRTNPKPSRLPDGRQLVFIVAQGSPDENFCNDIIPRYSRMLGRLGFSSIFPIRALGVGPGSDVLKNPAILDAIGDTAEKVIKIKQGRVA